MEYVFINPVVDNMYIKEELDEVLFNCGYKRVVVKTEWDKIVKGKYNEILKQTKLTVLDTRCPIVIDTISKYLNNQKTFVPQIRPILIHCAIEIANRKDLKGKKKIITTPCESLAYYGNKMKLEEVVFISWKQFLNKLNTQKKLKMKLLDESPIPLGFFTSLGVKTISISGKKNIENYFKNNLYESTGLVEMLYCNEGCHNGDGVLINE